MNTLCPECIARQEADRAKPGITGPGGWCAPADSVYNLAPECYIIQPRRLRLGRRPWQWRWRWQMWREHQALVGQMAHGYSYSLELPEFTVPRGGITYPKATP